ncbi:hypothetical protein L1987_45032 [Smallanthus sonchifolius]|uniref:Uncharacterized protein n=1 Tax=Smallanthus sonchifolius TaxID=185202 RepID=A0ACB9GS99_9ASTR|nr:hypothetical protein L1987_45032 [Smallanthus sonchifolius]
MSTPQKPYDGSGPTCSRQSTDRSVDRLRINSFNRSERTITPIGEVTDSSTTPIYGNGKNQPVLKLESSVKIPPRPRAQQVERIRQQRVIRGISHITVAEALRRIGIKIGLIEENPVFQRLNSAGLGSKTSPSLLHSSEAGGSSRHRSRRFSRVIYEISSYAFPLAFDGNSPKLTKSNPQSLSLYIPSSDCLRLYFEIQKLTRS